MTILYVLIVLRGYYPCIPGTLLTADLCKLKWWKTGQNTKFDNRRLSSPTDTRQSGKIEILTTWRLSTVVDACYPWKIHILKAWPSSAPTDARQLGKIQILKAWHPSAPTNARLDAKFQFYFPSISNSVSHFLIFLYYFFHDSAVACKNFISINRPLEFNFGCSSFKSSKQKKSV